MREIKFKVWSKALQSMFWFDVTWGNSWGMGVGNIYENPIQAPTPSQGDPTIKEDQ